jgi:predicted nucleic acid-binding protein
VLLDTSVLVEIFQNPADSARFRKIMSEVGVEEVYVSMVQLAEVADWATRNGAAPERRVEAVKRIASIVPLDESICLEAVEIKQKRRRAGHSDFGLIDGIVLATARSVGQRVLTLDAYFKGDDGCTVLR